MKRQIQPLAPAALYTRVSSDRQDVDLSVAAQLRALRDYPKSNGYSLGWRVRGRSRERPHRRPAPVRMWPAGRSHPFNNWHSPMAPVR